MSGARRVFDTESEEPAVKSKLYRLALAGLPLSLAACASAGPSQELKTARDAYAKTRQSAAQVNPEGTMEAERALRAAEKAHTDDAGSALERTHAYVATRKSELAMAQAGEARAREDREKAEQVYQAELEREVGSLHQALQGKHQELQSQQSASDQAHRERAGWRRKGEDMVITLSGVVFETGGYELSSDAKTRLDVVIHAAKQNPSRSLTIAGFTDDTGRAETNRELSQRRANAVKAYLESQGIAASRIFSEGRGESNPVASNDTTEGRAENRRVEITLERAEPSERMPVKGVDPEPMEAPEP
jgi:outer membrane protein OmpA-like peptidoglycan-associated protein